MTFATKNQIRRVFNSKNGGVGAPVWQKRNLVFPRVLGCALLGLLAVRCVDEEAGESRTLGALERENITTKDAVAAGVDAYEIDDAVSTGEIDKEASVDGLFPEGVLPSCETSAPCHRIVGENPFFELENTVTSDEWRIAHARDMDGNEALWFQLNGDTRLLMDNDGALSIGNDKTPAGSLHVEESVNDRAIRVEGFERGDGEDNVLISAQDRNHWIWQVADDWGVFWAGWDGATYDTDTDTGNPKEVVFVGGGEARAAIDLKRGDAHFNTVNAREIVVESEWADYVFDGDYRLMSLRDVEKHIEKKGHLPNVPSAEEVQNRGVRIGESQATLLRKIEELTLYTIQQQHLIDAQAAAVAAQAASLKTIEAELHALRKQTQNRGI